MVAPPIYYQYDGKPSDAVEGGKRMMDGDMIVLSPETEQLARLVAERCGKTPEQVLDEAMEACAREVGIVPTQEPPGKPSVNRMMAISDRFASYSVLDTRSADDIIGYGEFGVPH
jgi:hypothetical protein